MLPKEKRLNLKKDFKWVASGKRLNHHHFSVFIKYGENEFPKIGIATSKNYFKKATDRNRARRLLSKALESIYEALPHNINIIALPKSGVIDVKSEELLKELEKELKNKNLLIAEP